MICFNFERWVGVEGGGDGVGCVCGMDVGFDGLVEPADDMGRRHERWRITREVFLPFSFAFPFSLSTPLLCLQKDM